MSYKEREEKREEKEKDPLGFYRSRSVDPPGETCMNQCVISTVACGLRRVRNKSTR